MSQRVLDRDVYALSLFDPARVEQVAADASGLREPNRRLVLWRIEAQPDDPRSRGSSDSRLASRSSASELNTQPRTDPSSRRTVVSARVRLVVEAGDEGAPLGRDLRAPHGRAEEVRREEGEVVASISFSRKRWRPGDQTLFASHSSSVA